MSLRMRLALHCVALCGLILLLVGLLSYVLHVRGHYDDRDRALVSSAEHIIASSQAMAGAPHLIAGSGGLEIGFRLYGPDGALREHTPGVETLPRSDPQAIMAHPSVAPFDALAGLAPPLAAINAPPDSAFGLLTTNEQRWRVYVVPLTADGHVTGYIEALTPLGQLDASILRFRFLLLTAGLVGLAGALLGSMAVAGRALRPIAQMTATAHTITRSRDLSRRIAQPPIRDELGTLADTFNAMLASIEEAYRAQQRFVADASHELRAPLTAIQGNLELLRRRHQMPAAERDEALAEIEREAYRLTRLVADLLALARADAGVMLKHRPVDLDVVVLDAFHTARQLAHGQTLTLDPFVPVQVNGDRDRLAQLLLILLDNAIKYTPADGQVTLGLRHCADGAEVLVQDTGIGIPAADLPHVVERFYRADPARGRDPGGTGLGLAIAHWIVTQHEGTLALHSQPGQGTTAIVRLPVRA